MVINPNLDNNIDYLKRKKHELIDKCPKCSGTNLKCSCYAKYDIEVRKVRSNIPLAYRDASLSYLRRRLRVDTSRALKDYIQHISNYKKIGKGLYLYGPSESAKTYCGCAILNKAIATGFSAFFISLTDCVDEIMKNSNSFFIEILKSVSFLLIDDIGYSYRPSKNAEAIAYIDSILDKIIRFRKNNLLPLILTSHKTVEEMAESNISGIRVASFINSNMITMRF